MCVCVCVQMCVCVCVCERERQRERGRESEGVGAKEGGERLRRIIVIPPLRYTVSCDDAAFSGELSVSSSR